MFCDSRVLALESPRFLSGPGHAATSAVTPLGPNQEGRWPRNQGRTPTSSLSSTVRPILEHTVVFSVLIDLSSVENTDEGSELIMEPVKLPTTINALHIQKLLSVTPPSWWHGVKDKTIFSNATA